MKAIQTWGKWGQGLKWWKCLYYEEIEEVVFHKVKKPEGFGGKNCELGNHDSSPKFSPNFFNFVKSLNLWSHGL